MTGKRKKMQGLGVVIRRIRDEKNLSQAVVAERLNVDRAYISLLENEKSYPSIDQLVRVAHALDIRPGALLDAVVMEDTKRRGE